MKKKIFIPVLLFIFGLNLNVLGQYSFDSTPLLQIIESVEEKSDYRFLYRESQIADITLSFTASEDDIIEQLSSRLQPYQIALKADSSRKQVVLYRSAPSVSTQTISISGQVVDATTGERLPYATVYWETGESRKGTAANTSGVFRINTTIQKSDFTFSASYLGYRTGQITLDQNDGNSFEDVTIRLQPETVFGNDIVITGSNYITGSDTLYSNFVQTGVLSPFGENNTTRALQSLPSVTNNTAVNNGINVRGSSADATHILLDGITIYNQSHLFGLLDSFNPNALQTSGFFYDVTPAQFPSAPGGTLTMLTKTGSLNDFNSSAGLSNTAFNTTLEGPIKKGKSSWLLSGRASTMNEINWFGNDELIAYGLNIERPSQIIADNLTDLQSSLVTPGDYDASFFDLHGKIYFEFENGSRLKGGAYYGADNVSQEAERLVRRFDPDNPSVRFSEENVQTLNNWGNFSSSISYSSPISSTMYSSSTAAVSIYETEFSKDDFVYNRIENSGNGIQVFTFPLRNQSVFNEMKLNQSFDVVLPDLQWTFGGSFQYFMGEYFEESFDRPGFLNSFESGLADLFTQVDYTELDPVHIHFGSRLHYYTDGDFLAFSPRIKFKLFKDQPVSLGLGYSRNFQFTHRLSFYNVSSPDVWISSSKEQPATESDYFTAGVYFKLFGNTLLQVEGYHKSLENARLFEINAQTLTNSFDSPPWLFDNDGTAQGIELLVKNRFRKITFTNSYTLSESTFSNPAILDGNEFYAAWDRTHSFNSTVEFNPLSDFTLFTSFTASSGAPNRLYFLQYESQERLSNYRRIDAGVEYRSNIKDTELEFNASVFNLTDRNNTWYRELNLVIDTSEPENRQRLSSQAIDVYDLGIQPSFNLTVWF